VRLFLAGASGAIGRRLTPLLIAAGHRVSGITRSAANVRALEAAGVSATVVDVFDADALKKAVAATAPEVVIHQLTDLPHAIENESELAAAYPRNARIRIDGTRNLIAAAKAARARRFIVQSVAFAYAPGGEPHPETDPLNVADGPRAVTVRAAADMESQALSSGLAAIRKPPLHIDAAAQAALLAVTRGAPGVYNIAEEDGTVSIAKARAELGFDPDFRLPA
jgi:nucleoside-diphosphate-sugar epimerase